MTPLFTDDENYPRANRRADGQLRTVQHHVQVWRTPTVLTFADNGWLDEVAETGPSLPPPLRVSVDLAEDAEQSA